MSFDENAEVLRDVLWHPGYQSREITASVIQTYLCVEDYILPQLDKGKGGTAHRVI